MMVKVQRSVLFLALCAAAAGELGPRRIRAVLFDFDGSLAQSETAHRRRFAGACGAEISEERWFGECVGHSSDWIVAHVTGAPATEAIRADLSARAAAPAFVASIEPTRGALALVRALRAKRVDCAIVSSGSRCYIEACVEAWGVRDAFAVIVAGDDATPAAKKPDPAPYAHAAALLGVGVADCVAVEDSPSGVESALAAGARVVALSNPALAERPDLLAAVAAARADLTDRALFGV